MPTAVIIAGGEGTRLRPLTLSMPKPLAPMLGHPFLDYQLALIKGGGIRRAVFNLHYMADAITRHYGDGSEEWGMEFRYSIEHEPRGTAGAVKMGEEFFGSDELVIFNGDVLSDIDISRVIDYHRKMKARVTITLVRVDDPTAYGLVFIDDNGRVEKFLEKPSREQATVDTINAGLYVMNRDVIDEIPPDIFYTFEKGLYPAMLDKGDPVYGFVHEGYWLDIGTPGKYLLGCADLATGRAANPFILDQITPDGIYGHPGVKIDSLTGLQGPCFFDKGCVIKGGKIGPNVFLGRNVTIGAGTKVANSIILDNCSIGDGAVVNSALICPHTSIGDNIILNRGSLIGGFTRISSL